MVAIPLAVIPGDVFSGIWIEQGLVGLAMALCKQLLVDRQQDFPLEVMHILAVIAEFNDAADAVWSQKCLEEADVVQLFTSLGTFCGSKGSGVRTGESRDEHSSRIIGPQERVRW